MSERFSRRVFLRGLGVVAAAAALTACSSTNEAVNQALIEGAVGGIVAADCKIGRSSYWAANATVPVYEISFRIVMTNVSSKPVTLSADNFATTLDGTPMPPFHFGARDVGDADIWRTYDSLTIRPGEERSIDLAYEINKPTYDSWYNSSRTVAVSFTCGNQRVTYTKNSRSDEIIVSDIETL